MTALTWLGVAAFGGIGAILRFLVDATVSARMGRDFPLGTFVVNISGAFALGLLTGLTVDSGTALLAGTATLGAYTTFSTWMLETQRMAEDGEFVPAVANVVVSLAVGLGAAELGRLLGAHL